MSPPSLLLALEWMSPMNNIWKTMLDKLTSVWYNDTPERGTGSTPSTANLFAKETTMGDFANNKTEAKIQGLSIQVGELFADLSRTALLLRKHVTTRWRLTRAFVVRSLGSGPMVAMWGLRLLTRQPKGCKVQVGTVAPDRL